LIYRTKPQGGAIFLAIFLPNSAKKENPLELHTYLFLGNILFGAKTKSKNNKLLCANFRWSLQLAVVRR
jgi:hypothetical protein